MRVRSTSRRAGLSLLEVLAALAIFFFSVVVISQMVDSASRIALRSQQLARASLLCESRMDEMALGVLPLQNTGWQPIEDAEPGWFYAVSVQPEQWTTVAIENQSVQGLNTVHVSVMWSSNGSSPEVEHTMSRVLLDPRLRVPLPQQATTSSSTESSGASNQEGGGAGGRSSGRDGGGGPGRGNGPPGGGPGLGPPPGGGRP